MKENSLKTGLILWFSVVAFYIYQYIIRVSPSVMAADIMSDLLIDASVFGALSASATYVYSLLQIPAGILADVYETRRVVLTSALLCLSGVTLFALSDSLLLAYTSRLMIGAGSACAFLCVVKIINKWFPNDKKTVMFGFTITAGTIGALLGGKPLAHLTTEWGWRYSLLILSAVGLMVFLINFFAFKEKKHHSASSFETTDLKKTIKAVFKNKTCWAYSLVATGIYMCISVFADLWGVSFLMLKLTIDKQTAASLIGILYAGLCIGCVSITWITRKMEDRNPALLLGTFMVALIMGIVIYVPNLQIFETSILLFSIGLFSGVEILCFANACESMDIAVAGTISGFINFIVTLGAAIIQQEVGFVLNLLWDGTLNAVGEPDYTIADFQGAMGGIVVASTAASMLVGIIMLRRRQAVVP